MSGMSEQMFGHLVGNQIGLNRENNDLAQQVKSGAETINSSVGALVNAGNAVVALREEVSELSTLQGGYAFSLAGMRGVTRELLAELRKADPKNPLLDKKNRDAVFSTVFEHYKKNLTTKPWKEVDEAVVNNRDELMGAKNSSRGGPEKADITSNTQLRKHLGIPDDHVTDRERFLGLISKLTEELQASNPDSDVLKDKALVEVFDEIRKNESQ